MDPVLSQITGYAASLCVLATFCMRSMRMLRGFAIVSNVAFLAYGVPLRLWPIVSLHAVLLPINIMRLREMRRSDVGALGRERRFRPVLQRAFRRPALWQRAFARLRVPSDGALDETTRLAVAEEGANPEMFLAGAVVAIMLGFVIALAMLSSRAGCKPAVVEPNATDRCGADTNP